MWTTPEVTFAAYAAARAFWLAEALRVLSKCLSCLPIRHFFFCYCARDAKFRTFFFLVFHRCLRICVRANTLTCMCVFFSFHIPVFWWSRGVPSVLTFDFGQLWRTRMFLAQEITLFLRAHLCAVVVRDAVQAFCVWKCLAWLTDYCHCAFLGSER